MNTQTKTFSYNSRSELTNAVLGGVVYNYAYDTYTVNALNQYTAISSWPNTYDADGNLVDYQDWTFYEWDESNRLKAVMDYDGYRCVYEYDRLGRRISKSMRHPSGRVLWHTRFISDGWNLIAELRCDPVTDAILDVKYFLWGLDVSHTFQSAGGIGGLLAAYLPTGATYMPCYDAAGHVYHYVGSDGVLYSPFSASYDPFGTTGGGAGGALPFWFSTKYFDTECFSFLYYFGLRPYSPEFGRFIPRDPLEESGGLNLYAYCENDPINKWDYLGMYSHQHNCSQEQLETLKKTEDEVKRRTQLWLSCLGNMDAMELLQESNVAFSLKNLSLVSEFINEINKSFKKIDAGLTKNEYGFECECKCKKEWLAYVRVGGLWPLFDDDVHFCPLYFEETEKQTKIMGHEFSHYFLKTKDKYNFYDAGARILNNVKYAQFFEHAYYKGTNCETIRKHLLTYIKANP